MSTKESIKILIQGEDQASAKIHEAAAKTKEALAQIKQTGQQTKASTEFIGQLANQLGGTELGAFAGQIAQLTEKTSQFSEVAKAGGAGALAFQAGLAALVATMGFKFGQFIGDAIFQTERWKEELAAAEKQALALDAALLKALGDRFADAKLDIELIADPEEKRAEYEKLLQDLSTEAAGIEAKIKQAADAIKNRDTFDEDANIFGMFGVGTDSEEIVRVKQQEIEVDKERLKLINEQTMALQKQLGERAKERELAAQKKQEIESDQKALQALEKRLELEKAIAGERDKVQGVRDAIKEEIASGGDPSRLAKEEIASGGDPSRLAGDFSNASQQFDVQASQTVFGDDNQQRAAALMEEMEFLKTIQEIEKEIAQERKAAIASQEQEARKVNDAYLREMESLEQQITLLRDGKEAARQMALEKQGIAKEDAKRFVEMQKQLEDQQKVDDTRPTAANTAQESRVMIRGDVDQSPVIETAKNTEESKKILNQMLAELKAQNERRTQNAASPQIEFVGVSR